MNEQASRNWIDQVRRVVIKIGSRALVRDDSHLDHPQIESLVEQMQALIKGGRQVICVSSGAVAAGVADLGLRCRPRDLPGLQAAASAGQAHLISFYRDCFARYGIPVGQVLLTHADLRQRERHLNARNTLSYLLEAGAIPIINENDTVAVEEIKVGDNDILSALVMTLVQADLLIMLTTADGLYSRPPGVDPGPLIPRVSEISPMIEAMAGGAGSSVGTGGMRSKIEAARMVMRAGERMVIANARTPGILEKIFAGSATCTFFEPASPRLAGRKRWIAFFHHPRGVITVDPGAVKALRERGGSLLAIGVKRVEGSFLRGAPVTIVSDGGEEIGRGLVNYPAEELVQIQGKRSADFMKLIGHCEYEEVIHRDNLVLR
ncbi:MAG: glutamate 5-kinase [Verrucomicrobiota bacterium]|jgi:glutamate 5-kinase|nr:glutamate 5-kinase [Verrucomicrobiota bacterium]MDD8050610.1 glutamate 5-kinase [Verrucomicrobiota bacterium]MDI9383031.1 glutamate 5-kinase [Verrucomicrobiota bacterium]